MILPLESTPSVSPSPTTMTVYPPLNSTTGSVYALLFCEAFIPSSDAVILIFPSFICTYVASMPSLACMVISPPSICTYVVACMPSLFALILNVPFFMYIYPTLSSSLFSLWSPSLLEDMVKFPSYTAMESLASTASRAEMIL